MIVFDRCVICNLKIISQRGQILSSQHNFLHWQGQYSKLIFNFRRRDHSTSFNVNYIHLKLIHDKEHHSHGSKSDCFTIR